MNNKIELSNHTKAIVMAYFNNPNMSQKDLALQFNISPARVSQILSSKRVLDTFPLLAKAKVKSLIPKAVDTLEFLMKQTVNMNVSEKVVSKVLDHAKVLEPSPQLVIHELRLKPIEELQAIVDDAKRIGSGPVIDGELV